MHIEIDHWFRTGRASVNAGGFELCRRIYVPWLDRPKCIAEH